MAVLEDQTTTPRVAPSETTLISSALTGMTTDPVMRKSRTRVARATRAKAIGARSRIESVKSAQPGGLADT